MVPKKKRRAKGTGRVIRLPRGFYVYQYVDATGKRITESLKVKAKSKAQEMADEHVKVLTADDAAQALVSIAKAKELIQIEPLPPE